MRNASKYQTYNIIGAGAFGVFLSHLLKSRLLEGGDTSSRVILHEKGNTIMPGWHAVGLNSIRTNNGFHGLEMPRANAAFSILSKLLYPSAFSKINNHKLCFINSNLLPFRSPLSSFPPHLRIDLESLLTFQSSLNNKPLQYSDVPKSFLDSHFGQLLHLCSLRYSSTLSESWSSFFPWSFPNEFISDTSDEGWSFRDTHQKSYYLTPQSGIFEDWINPIHSELERTGVEIQIQSNIVKDLEANRDDSSLNIWASSAANLLALYDKESAQKLFVDKRFFHLALLAVNKGQFMKWIEKYSYPSEVIVVAEKCSHLCRVSFPQTSDTSSASDQTFVLAELLSSSPSIDHDTRDGLVATIEEMIQSPAELVDLIQKRVIFNVNQNLVNNAQSALNPYLDESPFMLHSPYWWPINIAKCAHYADDSATKILANL